MEMAKTKNEKYPWLSWIPYAKEYLLGMSTCLAPF